MANNQNNEQDEYSTPKIVRGAVGEGIMGALGDDLLNLIFMGGLIGDAPKMVGLLAAIYGLRQIPKLFRGGGDKVEGSFVNEEALKEQAEEWIGSPELDVPDIITQIWRPPQVIIGEPRTGGTAAIPTGGEPVPLDEPAPAAAAPEAEAGASTADIVVDMVTQAFTNAQGLQGRARESRDIELQDLNRRRTEQARREQALSEMPIPTPPSRGELAEPFLRLMGMPDTGEYWKDPLFGYPGSYGAPVRQHYIDRLRRRGR